MMGRWMAGRRSAGLALITAVTLLPAWSARAEPEPLDPVKDDTAPESGPVRIELTVAEPLAIRPFPQGHSGMPVGGDCTTWGLEGRLDTLVTNTSAEPITVWDDDVHGLLFTARQGDESFIVIHECQCMGQLKGSWMNTTTLGPGKSVSIKLDNWHCDAVWTPPPAGEYSVRYRIRTSRDPQAIEHLRRWGRPASAAEILEPCQAMLNNDEFWGDAAVSNTLEMELEQRELEPGELTSLDEFGSTRLHDAPNPCWAGRLLAAGADVGAPNARGQTALHTAYDVEVVRLLLEHGADPNVQDENGSSPLHIHAEGWSLDIVRALLDGGAVVELKDKEGRTPLEKAEQGGPSVNAEIVTLLKKHAAR